jgi:predicted HicB family RNase H-like nuclease
MRRKDHPSAKLQIYLPQSLRDDVDAAAADAGQTLSKFVERTLNPALRKTETAQ